MGAEEQDVELVDLNESDATSLEWVIGDVLNHTPWFYKMSWFERFEKAGYLTLRGTYHGEVLQHRHATHVAKGVEVVVTKVSEKALSWYRARRVAEILRGEDLSIP